MMARFYQPGILETLRFEHIKTIKNEGIIVTVKDEEYEAGSAVGDDSWSEEKTGRYGSGLIERPSALGKLGEIAVSKVIGYPVSSEYIEFGSPIDIDIPEIGKAIQVKTSTTVKTTALIISKDYTDGKRVNYVPTWRWNYCVWVLLMDRSDDLQCATFFLPGWTYRDTIAMLPDEPSYVCPGIINKYVKQMYWNPIEDLIQKVRRVPARIMKSQPLQLGLNFG